MQSFEMTQNSILARYAGASLFSVNRARLFENTITIPGLVAGLYIGQLGPESHENNRFATRLSPSIFRAFRVPGIASISANPEMLTPAAAVIITDFDKNEPMLLNAVINSQLFQLTSTTVIGESTPSSESNRFEDNILNFDSTPIDGIVLDLAIDTRVVRNKIHAPGGVGIQERLQNELPKELPGRCAMEPSRLCLADDGCQLLGFDLVNKGPCSSREVRKVSSAPVNTQISLNELIGPLKSGIVVAGSNTRVFSNTIRGPIGDVRFDAGIRLEGKHGIETADVKNNRVLNVATALSLVQRLEGLKAATFGAKITNNDFIGHVVAVMTSMTSHTAAAPGDPNYDLLTELSLNGIGNFWNTTCAIGLAPNKVRKTDGSINCLVRDSHPLPSSFLGSPTPCPTLPHTCVGGLRANQRMKKQTGRSWLEPSANPRNRTGSHTSGRLRRPIKAVNVIIVSSEDDDSVIESADEYRGLAHGSGRVRFFGEVVTVRDSFFADPMQRMDMTIAGSVDDVMSVGGGGIAADRVAGGRLRRARGRITMSIGSNRTLQATNYK